MMEKHHLIPPDPASPKTDRRIQRTKHFLQEALIALMLEKGYDAITVQDILDRANMGRSTFYAHYRDKEDLLLSGFQTLFEPFQREYMQSAATGNDPVRAGKDLSLFFFQHAASNRGLYKAMIGEQGGRVVMEHIRKYLTDFIAAHLAANIPQERKDLPVDLLAHYIASSYLALLTWWLDHDLPYTAEQMDALYQQLVFPGVQQITTPIKK